MIVLNDFVSKWVVKPNIFHLLSTPAQSITGASPSDCLISYQGHSSAEMQLVHSQVPTDWASGWVDRVASFIYDTFKTSSSSLSSWSRSVSANSPLSLSLCIYLSDPILHCTRQVFKLHPVPAHSWCTEVLPGWPTLTRPCVEVHKRMSLMSSSFLHQQCSAYRSFKWTNSRAHTEKIFSASLTAHIIIFSRKEKIKINIL